MKKTRLTKMVSVALALCLVTVLLAGCGGGKDKDEGEANQLSQYVYVPEFVEIDAKTNRVENVQMLNDRVYFAQYKQISGPEIDENTAYEELTEEMMMNNQIFAADGSVVNDEDVVFGNVISSIKTDGTDLQDLTDYKPVEFGDDDPNRQAEHSNISGYAVDADGNFVVCEEVYVTIYDFPEGFDKTQGDPYEYYKDNESHFFIRHLDKTGKEISAVDLYEELKEDDQGDEGSYFYVQDMAMDNAGNVFINAGENCVYIFDKDGNKKSKVETDNWIHCIFADKDGNIKACVDADDGQNIAKIDVEKGEFTDETPMPQNLYRVTAGSGDYEFLSNDGSSLFGCNSGDEEATEILNWLNCDVDSNQVVGVKILDDGRILALLNHERTMYRGRGSYEETSNEPAMSLVYLTKTPRSEIAQKTTLKLACMYDPYELRSEILDFNKKSDTTRIEVEDYSKYSTEEDWTAGITKLNTEIISGNVPDIISLSQIPYEQYVSKGLLEDLYQYIDNDEAISREDFIPSLLKAQEIDGKLYQASGSCNITTLVASEDVVGSEIGWTMQEMLETVKKYPDVKYPFGYYMSRPMVMQYILAMQLSDYVDWSTGECNFDNEDFKGLLEFASTFPEEYPEEEDGQYHDEREMVMNGEQLFQITDMYDLHQLQEFKSMYHDTHIYKGIPCSDKSGNIAMFDSALAITSSCKDKEAAWQLVRTVLTKDYQENSWGVATRQDILDESVKNALKEAKDENSASNTDIISSGEIMFAGEDEVEMKPIEKKDVDKYLAAINSVTKSMQFDTEIMDIVDEEAAAYFSGQKTLDEVTSVIQSRVSLYVNEQK